VSIAPRCVIVERPTEMQGLLARHGTREQTRFFLAGRGLDLAEVESRHQRAEAARATVTAAIPADWRVASIDRADLDRFLFAEDDIVVALGQDGLVANVAKYLEGQPVVGVNPDPGRYPGVLVNQAPDAVGDLLADLAAGRATVQTRTMVRATLDDGQQVDALNELFIGHRTHQSARYTLTVAGVTETQSSSGLVVATGTGATGWAQSISHDRGTQFGLPTVSDARLAWFVREAWESPATGAELREGLVERGEQLQLTSELGEDGVVFGDGIEADSLTIDWGQTLTVMVSDRSLSLVV